MQLYFLTKKDTPYAVSMPADEQKSPRSQQYRLRGREKEGLFLYRKGDEDGRSLSRGALHRYLAAQVQHRVLDDGQAQTRAADLPASA